MKYSGSITLKKTELISLIEDENHIFRSKISKNNKWFSFGSKSAYSRILYADGHTHFLFPPNNFDLKWFSDFWNRIEEFCEKEDTP